MAMELLAQGKPNSEKTSINAYYTLEQPVESICQIATGVGLGQPNFIHFFPGSGDLSFDSDRDTFLSLIRDEIGKRVIYILNFHAGFLLPEEFLEIIKCFISDINGKKYPPIKRVLFNSTGHLPERYPLMDGNPLILHALGRILKREEIGLMIIGVRGMQRDERIMGLAAVADLKISVHDATDERLPGNWKEELRRAHEAAHSNVRIISSDNVTGKDYSKRYRLLSVENNEIVIKAPEKEIKDKTMPVSIAP